MTGDIYLGGGGSELDERNLWARAFTPGSTIAIWPFALSGRDARQASIAWFSSALVRHGDFTIEGWCTSGDGDRSLSGVDIVAIPGGNTFNLLQELRYADLISPLAAHVGRGGSLYGGSAGAVLAGADISIASWLDSNDAGIEETTGMDMLQGTDVLPHFTVDQLPRVQNHTRSTGRSVMCIPERGGVVVSANGVAWNAGPEPVDVVTPNEHGRRRRGEYWKLPGTH